MTAEPPSPALGTHQSRSNGARPGVMRRTPPAVGPRVAQLLLAALCLACRMIPNPITGARLARPSGVALAWVAAWLLVASPALSQSLSAGRKPWHQGVSTAQQEAAEEAFLAGNLLFERSEYAGAAERYRVALGQWAHPAIQFNLAVCLIHLEQPLEAHDLLQQAVRFGRDGLRDHFDEAQNYLKLLAGRVATLEVELPEGAEVTLDGAPLRAERGRLAIRRLAPGRHALVAKKARYETWSKALVLPPGEVTREVITLRAPRTRTVRRWSPVIPWSVLGAGAVLTALGSAGIMIGNADQRAVDVAVEQRCRPPIGCPTGLPPDLAQDADRARLEQRLGVSVVAAGGVAVVTGIALLVLNQPRQVLESSRVSVVVAPSELFVGVGHAF